MSRPRRLLALASLALPVALPLALACNPSAEEVREDVFEAIAQGDRAAALESLESMRESVGESPDADLEHAGLLVRAGNAPEASWVLEESARQHPDRADIAVALGRVSLLLGNAARAREVVEAIAPETEQHPIALVLRAQAELKLGDLEQALATLIEAEETYPDRREARLVRINTLLSEDRKDEARALAEETRASLQGEDEEALAVRRSLDLLLAQLQSAQGELDEAEATLEALIAAVPGDPKVWQALVAVLVKAERSEEALLRVQAALEGPEPPAPLHVLAAQLHALAGDDERARDALQAFAGASEFAFAYQPLLRFEAMREGVEAALAVIDEALTRYPDDPGLRFQRAEYLIEGERLDEARREMDRFREATFDGDPQLEFLAARLRLAEGDAEGAARQLTALAPRLDRPATQYWIGRALEQTGDLEGARRRYALAARGDPQWPAPTIALIGLEQRRGSWRLVTGLAQRLVRVAPQELTAWAALAHALERLGEPEPAEKVAREIVERFPEESVSKLLLARALRMGGETDEALAALDEAASMGHPAAEIAAVRIRTLAMAGQLEAARVAARAAISDHADAADVQAAAAVALFALGKEAEGLQASERALAIDPDEPSPLRERCMFRASRQQWQSAADDCARYLASRSEDAEITLVRAVALHQLGRADEAVAAYRRAAALDEGDARPHNNLAELLGSQGDVEGALAAAQEAYRLDGDNPYVADTLGALYLRKGLTARAISVLEAAHAAAPDLPDAKLHLGLAYRDAGRSEDARRLLAAVDASPQAAPELRASAKEALAGLP